MKCTTTDPCCGKLLAPTYFQLSRSTPRHPSPYKRETTHRREKAPPPSGASLRRVRTAFDMNNGGR
eukprot:2363622-Lingulodinium_polyedra.AAC.1